MAIDLQYKGTAALADGRRLPSDRGCAGDTAGVTSLGTALTGDTARGHIAGHQSAQGGDTARGHLTGNCGAHWGTQLGVTLLGTSCPPWDTAGAQPAAPMAIPPAAGPCGQRAARPGHVPQTLAAAAAVGAHPRCVGGPWPCPCRDTAVTRSASPSWMERRPQPGSELFDLFYHPHWPTDHSALGFLSSLIIVP